MFKKCVAVVLVSLMLCSCAYAAAGRKNPYRARKSIPRVSVKNLPPITLGEFYHVKVILSDKGQISLNLPEGLSFNPETSEISGIVSGDTNETLSFSAENDSGNIVQEFLLRVIR